MGPVGRFEGLWVAGGNKWREVGNDARILHGACFVQGPRLIKPYPSRKAASKGPWRGEGSSGRVLQLLASAQSREQPSCTLGSLGTAVEAPRIQTSVQSPRLFRLLRTEHGTP